MKLNLCKDYYSILGFCKLCKFFLSIFKELYPLIVCFYWRLQLQDSLSFSEQSIEVNWEGYCKKSLVKNNFIIIKKKIQKRAKQTVDYEMKSTTCALNPFSSRNYRFSMVCLCSQNQCRKTVANSLRAVINQNYVIYIATLFVTFFFV